MRDRPALHLARYLPRQIGRVLRRLQQRERLHLVALAHADRRSLAVRVLLQRLAPVTGFHAQRRLPRPRRQFQEDRHHQVVLVVYLAVRLEHALAVVGHRVRRRVGLHQRHRPDRNDHDRHPSGPVRRRPLQHDPVARNHRVVRAVVEVEDLKFRLIPVLRLNRERVLVRSDIHAVLGAALPAGLADLVARPVETLRADRPVGVQGVPRRHVHHRLARRRVHHQPSPGYHPAHDVVKRRQVAHRRLHALLDAPVDRPHQTPRPLLLQSVDRPLRPRPAPLRDADAELRPRNPLDDLVRVHLRRVRRVAPKPLHRLPVTVHLLVRLQPVQPVVPLHAVTQRKSLLLVKPHRANDLVRVVDVRWHMSSPSSHIRATASLRRSPTT